MTGTVIRAISGFYDVQDGERVIRCRPRGKFRHSGVSPLAGDHVAYTPLEADTGSLDEILPRENEFSRPAVANMDQMVIIASGVNPVTDPFLIDRVAALAERKHCEPVICINKADADPCDDLFAVYQKAGFITLRISARTGEGIDRLARVIAGKTVAFTGNSGVGKSSILNALQPGLALPTGEVSDKLGRGRHTTRHVELFRLENGALVADTPGFAAFDAAVPELWDLTALPETFREFRPYLGRCRFQDCAHVGEPGCAVLAAVAEGEIASSRYESYVRLYRAAKEIPEWKKREHARS